MIRVRIFSFVMLFHLVFFAFGQAVGIILGSQIVLLGIGISFATWLLEGITRAGVLPDFVKYISPYHYVNMTAIARDPSFRVEDVFLLLAISLGLTILGIWLFRRKEVEI